MAKAKYLSDSNGDKLYPIAHTKAIYDSDGIILEDRLKADETDIKNKVDKVSGKDLSTNDYTTDERNKLANIESGAQVNTVTGIKGNSEANYRTGDVNITSANVGAAPISHSSAVATYGVGNSSNFGHVKLSDSVSSPSSTASGCAATPSAVKKAYDKAVEAQDSINTEQAAREAAINNIPKKMPNPQPLILSINSSIDDYEVYDGSEEYVLHFFAPVIGSGAGGELISTGVNTPPIWRRPLYAGCTTMSSVAAKTASIGNFRLARGVSVKIMFTNQNTEEAPTLNISNSGAINIVRYDEYGDGINLQASDTWKEGEIVEFLYDGKYWVPISSDNGFVQASRESVNALEERIQALEAKIAALGG